MAKMAGLTAQLSYIILKCVSVFMFADVCNMCVCAMCVCAIFSPSESYSEYKEMRHLKDERPPFVLTASARSEEELLVPELRDSKIENPIGALQTVVAKMGEDNPRYDIRPAGARCDSSKPVKVSCSTATNSYIIMSHSAKIAKRACAAGILAAMGIFEEWQIPKGKNKHQRVKTRSSSKDMSIKMQSEIDFLIAEQKFQDIEVDSVSRELPAEWSKPSEPSPTIQIEVKREPSKREPSEPSKPKPITLQPFQTKPSTPSLPAVICTLEEKSSPTESVASDSLSSSPERPPERRIVMKKNFVPLIKAEKDDDPAPTNNQKHKLEHVKRSQPQCPVS